MCNVVMSIGVCSKNGQLKEKNEERRKESVVNGKKKRVKENRFSLCAGYRIHGDAQPKGIGAF